MQGDSGGDKDGWGGRELDGTREGAGGVGHGMVVREGCGYIRKRQRYPD
jgi:hypothetical protein